MRKIPVFFIFVFSASLSSFAQARYDTNLQTQSNCPCGIGQSFTGRQNIYLPYRSSGISINCNNYSMLGPDYIPEGFYLFKKHKRKVEVNIRKSVAYYSMFKKFLTTDSIPLYAFNVQIK